MARGSDLDRMNGIALPTRPLLLVLAAALGALALLVIGAPGASAAPAGRYDHLIAPPKACPGQLNGRASAAVQTRAMRCLIDYARRRHGLRRTAPSAALDRSARLKAADILRCQQFSHTACGRRWDHWIPRRTIRMRSWSENIAWGSVSGGLSSPRAIMRSWLYSSTHRVNILAPGSNAKGVGLVRGRFSGYPAGVWVQHFARI